MHSLIMPESYVKVDIKGDDGDDSSSMDATFFSPHKFIGGPGSSGLLLRGMNYSTKPSILRPRRHLLLEEAQLILFQGGIIYTREISSIVKMLVRLAFFKLLRPG